MALFVLAFIGFGSSPFLYLVLDRNTIGDAAGAVESLQLVPWGTAITLPAILGYTVFSYHVFWGKTRHPSYD